MRKWKPPPPDTKAIDSIRIEAMVRLYHAAARRQDIKLTNEYARLVELLAGKIGFLDHGYLKWAHTEAERLCLE